MTAPESAYVVAGPAGYLGFCPTCFTARHDYPLDEARVYTTEAAAVAAQGIAIAASGMPLTVHEVNAAWMRTKQATR